MSNDKEPSKSVEEKSDDEKYLFERITTRAEVETETEVEAQVESSTEELNDYYSAMETGPTEDDKTKMVSSAYCWSHYWVIDLCNYFTYCLVSE
ncbi:MAG: hypothetical protein ACTSP7_14020 [Candidatus Heimdallarchaeota archaeon]